MIENYPAFFRFITVFICFCVYVFYLTPRQIREVLRPNDWLTGLRWLILAILTMTALTFIPSLVYLFYLSRGEEYEILRSVSSIIGGINLFGTTILMILIFNYRKKN